MFRSIRQAATEARMEEACFERSLILAVKVTVAEVVGSFLPSDSVAELSWWSIRCDSDMEIE